MWKKVKKYEWICLFLLALPQKLMDSLSAHVPSVHQISWKSIGLFLCCPAGEQTIQPTN